MKDSPSGEGAAIIWSYLAYLWMSLVRLVACSLAVHRAGFGTEKKMCTTDDTDRRFWRSVSDEGRIIRAKRFLLQRLWRMIYCPSGDGRAFIWSYLAYLWMSLVRLTARS